MRTKDDKKQEALFQATIKVVNEIGFAASSVSKIAKEAKISPATLYIYYRNKEDLLVSTYIEIKKSIGEELSQVVDHELPLRDCLLNLWKKIFSHISNNKEEFRFAEQFSNSPYTQLVDKEELNNSFSSVIAVLQRGIDMKIIKNVDFNILAAFIFHPITTLANPNLCSDFELNEETLEQAFQLAWDAIKL